MKLIHKETQKEIKKGDFIFNNVGAKFKFMGITPAGLIDAEADKGFHPISFSDYKVIRD